MFLAFLRSHSPARLDRAVSGANRPSRTARLAVAALIAATSLASAASGGPVSTGDLLQELRSFREFSSVLYVAAHPDDENNRLLPYLARGRAVRTAYLSLTRGDGGQNLIGPELGAELGVIRTHELLAARRVDGAQQLFGRAKDFGFSKDATDTLKRWNRQQVVADIVRAIRQFRPDVVIARFSPVPGGTHGHHTASAILALEAFKLAGDPTAFPDQLGGLPPWQPKRIFWNSWMPPGSKPEPAVVTLDAGGYDPLLGESFGEIGARGRSMHKSQGEGRSGQRGSGLEMFQLLGGEPAQSDLFDGIDTTWRRMSGGAEIAGLADALLADFDPLQPGASVPAVLALREKLAALGADPLIEEKRQQLDRILQACLGLFVETVVSNAQVVPGETLPLKHTAVVRLGSTSVRWVETRSPAFAQATHAVGVDLSAHQPVSREQSIALPSDLPLTHPYWLRQEGTEGMFRVDDATLIGRPDSPPPVPLVHVFAVGGQRLLVRDEPVQVITDAVRGEIRQTLQVIPPVSLRWKEDLQLVRPGATKTVVVEATAARAGIRGMLDVNAPNGWTVRPASRAFDLAHAQDREMFEFQITAPAAGGTGRLEAAAVVGDARYNRSRHEIRYEHIPVQLLQPLAAVKVVSFDVTTKGREVGYLPGAGDLIPESLRQLGYTVTLLTADELSREALQRFDTVIVGVRAFNTRGDLDARMPALFDYAAAGGTVIVQYNTAGGLLSNRLTPYALELSRERVTDASAAVTLLQPEHPVFRGPNRISDADFAGWVQERARFVPRSWDPRFVPLLAMADPGERPLTGTLLIAPHGRGHFVYTSLSWFRELPAGVPGAYRLFANLVSLGK